LSIGLDTPRPLEIAVPGAYYLPMTTIDIESLSPQERLDLIGQLWDSLDANDVQLTAAQAAELDRRLETLDEDIKDGRDAGDVLAELRHRYP
jgi:putative addiction module component (TIGR02574 family)